MTTAKSLLGKKRKMPQLEGDRTQMTLALVSQAFQHWIGPATLIRTGTAATPETFEGYAALISLTPAGSAEVYLNEETELELYVEPQSGGASVFDVSDADNLV